MTDRQSSVARYLLLVALALSFYAVGEVWLVQMSSYPLWRDVPPAGFEAYHAAWWHSIWSVIFVPSGLLTVCSLLMLRWRPPGVGKGAVWLGIVLQFLLYALTAAWWAPLMARLAGTTGAVYGPMYHLLLLTHWGRVAIVTAYGLLVLWMAGRSTSLAPAPATPGGRPAPAPTS